MGLFNWFRRRVKQASQAQSGTSPAPARPLARPFGNKARLAEYGQVQLFGNIDSARRWYQAFLAAGRTNKPPRVVEVLLANLSTEFWMDEKFACVFPMDHDSDMYDSWMNKCMGITNGSVRPVNTTDDEYSVLHKWITRVYAWEILVPSQVKNADVSVANLLSDDEHNCFPPKELDQRAG